MGFVCVVGGCGSYMLIMFLVNSLMFDFWIFVLFCFVYIMGEYFEGNWLIDLEVIVCVEWMVDEMILISNCL